MTEAEVIVDTMKQKYPSKLNAKLERYGCPRKSGFILMSTSRLPLSKA